ncbi:MAG: hypothetical protein NC037_04945 [Bacteroides sp.]|nr:hypothetical protein [Bacillota bacterium]MCM1394072.1 hypothetical protein [[Eubacterium] siraeum]MCM1455858.1 hypothetical protein [Bacteroides sp.]
MYTRCPSCRSEISFDPPANKDSLPENYRHRIKCPSCGVTIGVKINQNPQVLAQPYGRPQLAPPPGARTTAQPRQQARTNAYSAPRANNGYNQQRTGNNAYGYTQPRGYAQQQPRANYNTQRASYGQPAGYTPYNAPVEEPKAAPVKEKKQKTKTQQNVKKNTRVVTSEKKYGSLRNLTMIIFSLLLVAFSIVSYLMEAGILSLSESFVWLSGTAYFDGISVWANMFKNFAEFKSTIALLGPLGAFAYLTPLLVFTLSCINFIVAFVSLCGRKYGRVFNLLFSLIIGGLAIFAMFGPFFYLNESGLGIVDYLKLLATKELCLAIVGAGIGLLQILFAFIFLKSMYRTEPAPKNGGKNGNKKQPAKNAKGRR